MCEAMNITVKVTAAETQQNGLVERNNMIIANMLDMILEDQQLDLVIALSWCLNAENSLAKGHGFSPFQLVFCQNPKLPSIFNDKPPAFTPSDTNQVLNDNLIALHEAKEAFISSENSEKIRSALSTNIRTSGDAKFITGNKVYYKRANDRRWKGPASVLGQDGQQVLVKHGSYHIHVHPCRLTLERTPITIQSKNEGTQETQQRQQQQHNRERQHKA